MRDFSELIARLKQSDDNCNAECCECSGECLSSGCNIFSEAADAIEELLAKVPHWISVEERLPEDSVPVLATYRGYNTGEMAADLIVCLFEGTWCYWDGYPCDYDECRVVITHWMPLPAPPKGGNHDN